MKQVFRRVRDARGTVVIEEIPRPHCGPDQVLVETAFTLISSGTEASTLAKTPTELARQVLRDPWTRNAVKDLLLQGGLRQAVRRVRDELNLLRPVGYSGAGTVIATGAHVSGITAGDRVAFAAQGHAEIVCPSRNHVARVPDRVGLSDAAFVTVGGIAIQGVRRAEVEIGHWIAVVGLGLVGQLVAQVLRAAGCRVIGIDVNGERIALCRSLGAEHGIDSTACDPVRVVRELTGGHGVDRTVICAASQDGSVANQAMEMTRKQGRVVSVGLVKMHLERHPFFLRELDFSFSRAYGPGSYDPSYERGRVDYPYHYVRWTEQRNLQEFLRLLRDGEVRLAPLVRATYPLEQAQAAYGEIGRAGSGVAVLLSYGGDLDPKLATRVTSVKRPSGGGVRLGFIGSGNLARGTLIPGFGSRRDCRIRAICSTTGPNSASAAKLHGADYVTTDVDEVLRDPDVDAVVIATRHDSHANLVARAARAGKHVFVEKPLALDLSGLQDALTAVREAGVTLTVGYNRRYSSLAHRMRAALPPGPRLIEYLVSIPPVPAEHWTLDPVEGGGRLVGEAEHFFDFANFLADDAPADVFAMSAGRDDLSGGTNFTVTVRYDAGSLAQVTYTSRGSGRGPRETVRADCGGVTAVLTDWRSLKVLGRAAWRPLQSADMGHGREIDAFLRAMTCELPSDGVSAAARASAISLAALRSLEERRAVSLSELLSAEWLAHP